MLTEAGRLSDGQRFSKTAAYSTEDCKQLKIQLLGFLFGDITSSLHAILQLTKIELKESRSQMGTLAACFTDTRIKVLKMRL